MSGWLEALFGKAFTSGVSIPLSKGLNFTSGLAASLNPSTKQIDVVAAPTQANANTLAPLLRGAGLTVDSSGKLATRARPRNFQLQDYFLSGNTTTGSIGALGWNLLGSGSPTAVRVSTTSVGLPATRLNVTTSALGRSTLCLGDAENRRITFASQVDILQYAASAVSITAMRQFYGMAEDFSQEPSAMTHALGIYYDSAVSANYQIIARAAGVGAPVVTGTAAAVNTPQLVTLLRSGTTWLFYLGNTLVGSIASGIPTTAMNIGVRAEDLSGGTSVSLGYFGMSAQVAGAFDDDTFLEL